MAFAPDLRAFASGTNFVAPALRNAEHSCVLGLVTRQRSTVGKKRLGGKGKMGKGDIRNAPIIRAMSGIRWIIRGGVLPDKWLGRVLGRKPRMVADVALANNARTELPGGVTCSPLNKSQAGSA